MISDRKYVLVTGASSGIGRKIAIGLSEKYSVILHGRNEERLEETRSECSSSGEHIFFISDLNELPDLEGKLSTFIRDRNLEINHFVHCAGYMKLVPLKILTIETISTTMNTNLVSAALILKVLINHKINKGALKSVVLLSSNVSNFGARAFSIYGASKAGLDGLMRCLATELAPKVRINSVLPGAIKTGMTESIFANPETVQKMEADYPLGLGTPSDIFEIVDFLLSDKARWITGQQFTVDGGRTINITG